MKLTLTFCATALMITGCASTPDYACGQVYESANCQSLSETAKQTKNSLPPKIDSSNKSKKNESKVTISIPKPKQGDYTYANEYVIESRAGNIPNKSVKKYSDSSEVTTKEAVTHTSVDFNNDVKNIRSGGIQSNNKLAYVSPGTPLLTEPWVVNIYFTPYVNSYGDLDTGGNVYMKIQDSEWVLQR